MKIKVLSSDVLPSTRVLAEAASRGIEALVIAHLREKNNSTAPNRWGLPKTNYYAEASNNVGATVSGNKASVEIDHPGIALHYEGGMVYPKKKALAVPIDPTVAGIWPSEYGGEMFPVWPKGKSTGMLVGSDLNHEESIGKALYLLLPKATIPRDETVLPTDDQILSAAAEAVTEAVS